MVDPTSNHKRLHAVLQGRVQGVGMRYFVQGRAHDLQLKGFVRNLRNGDVELVAEGEQGALEALLAGLQQGPRSAHVENVVTVWSPATGEFTGFRVGSTL